MHAPPVSGVLHMVCFASLNEVNFTVAVPEEVNLVASERVRENIEIDPSSWEYVQAMMA